VAKYAEHIGYPLADKENLPQMAQYMSVVGKNMTDAQMVKEDYLNFIKSRLYHIAQAEGAAEEMLAEIEAEFDDLNFSEFATRLGYPKFEAEASHPLLVLADLPLPIYLTTSYHTFIEAALRRAGKKEVRTEVCRWHQGLESIPSVLDESYQPSKEAPLVYHLHGIDNRPDSLVLTEDDYMQFSVAISQDTGRETNPIPRRIRQALAESSLLMLGYNLRNWDFRGLFWGLIKSRPMSHLSVSLQLVDNEEERNYLQKYLNQAKFEVYWGSIEQYARELQEGL
jgi:SIR2-like domain